MVAATFAADARYSDGPKDVGVRRSYAELRGSTAHKDVDHAGDTLASALEAASSLKEAPSSATSTLPLEVGGSYVHDSSQDYFSTPDYIASHSVNDVPSGVNMAAEENRLGDRTEGSYSVDLPDGRTQVVTYYVDGDSGYHAKVEYNDEAEVPEPRGYSNDGDRVRNGQTSYEDVREGALSGGPIDGAPSGTGAIYGLGGFSRLSYERAGELSGVGELSHSGARVVTQEEAGEPKYKGDSHLNVYRARGASQYRTSELTLAGARDVTYQVADGKGIKGANKFSQGISNLVYQRANDVSRGGAGGLHFQAGTLSQDGAVGLNYEGGDDISQGVSASVGSGGAGEPSYGGSGELTDVRRPNGSGGSDEGSEADNGLSDKDVSVVSQNKVSDSKYEGLVGLKQGGTGGLSFGLSQDNELNPSYEGVTGLSQGETRCCSSAWRCHVTCACATVARAPPEFLGPRRFRPQC